MIKVGTSGYSYKDWKNLFYPPGTNSSSFLQHYSTFFNIVEINSTYYHIPKPQMFAAMINKVPEDFSFVVKLSKQFTHERNKAEKKLDDYLTGISPLIHQDKLTTLLAQFPYSFKPSPDSFDHLKYLREVFQDIPINVEFRNEFWIKEETFEFLRDNDLGFVSVDMPRLPRLVPPIVRSTSSIGYVRFHGRVKKHWWNPPEPHMRYDYLYEEKELKEWIPKIEELSKQTGQTLLFFNNHFQAKSAKNAMEISRLLELAPPEVAKNPDEMELPDNQNRLI